MTTVLSSDQYPEGYNVVVKCFEILPAGLNKKYMTFFEEKKWINQNA
jgi:hypothetical protein